MQPQRELFFDPAVMLQKADGTMADACLAPIAGALLAPQGSGKPFGTMWLIGHLQPLREWDTLIYVCSDVTYDSPATALLREHVQRHQVVDCDWDIKRIFEEANTRFTGEVKRTVVVSDPTSPSSL
jgi:hypothetical protein